MLHFTMLGVFKFLQILQLVSFTSGIENLITYKAKESNETLSLDFSCGQEQQQEQRSNLWPGRLWPNAEIVYQFHSSFSWELRHSFLDAAEHIGGRTCIKFRERRANEPGYLHVWANHDPKRFCGYASLCYTGQWQDFEIRWNCGAVFLMVHELLHSLCLIHEHQRNDRDQYLSFSQCNDPSRIPPITPGQISSGHLYDYTSQLHYPCEKCYGIPSMENVSPRCGAQVNREGLSVLDADKVNEYYNCQGCYRHRWYPVNTLTDERTRHLLNFALAGSDTEPVFVCRAYVKLGEIAPGRYRPKEKICQIPKWQMYNITNNVEVLALPGGPYSLSTTPKAGYYLSKRINDWYYHTYVPAGRASNNEKIFIAVTLTADSGEGDPGVDKTVIGKHFHSDSDASFARPVPPPIITTDFYTLRCDE